MKHPVRLVRAADPGPFRPVQHKPAPKNDDGVEAVAKDVGSPVAVLITKNEKDEWETRLYGATPDWLQFADFMCEAALRGLHEYEPE